MTLLVDPALKKFNRCLGTGFTGTGYKKFFEDMGWITLYSGSETELKRVPENSTLRSSVEIRPRLNGVHVKYSVMHPLDGIVKKGEFFDNPYGAAENITFIISGIIEPMVSGCTNIPELKSIYRQYAVK
ncbi:MAG: hypothetical protein V1648_02120 [Candidatus Aenigmatarchaeota archaeon]